MKKKLLCIAAVLAASSMAFAQADGEYYLYNESTKTFFCRGANYGTEASSDRYGTPVVWTSESGTLWTVDWTDVRIASMDGSSIYTDVAPEEAHSWKFTTAGIGTYYWQTSDGTKYVKLDAGSYGNYCHLVTSASEATVWKLLTKAQRDAIVEAYSDENIKNVIAASGSDLTVSNFVSTINGDDYSQVDCTNKIGTARFVGTIGSWKWAQVREQPNQPVYGDDYCEVYQATGTFTQTITGLQKGLYKVTVQGFSRSAAFDVCNDLETKGWHISNDYLKANGEQVQLEPWVVERTGTSNPNSPAEGIAAFNEDKYTNEVYTYVGADGKLELAIGIPTFKWGRWTLFNNFTLTYYASIGELKALYLSLYSALLLLDNDQVLNTYFQNKVTNTLSTVEGVNVNASTIDELQAAVDLLDATVSEVEAAKVGLENLKNEIAVCRNNSTNSISDAYAKNTFDAAIATAESGWNDAQTVEKIETLRTNLESARQAYVKMATPINNATFDMTFMMVNADCSTTEGWTIEGPVGTKNGQHWSSDDADKYFELCNWAFDSWNSSASRTVTLPSGMYLVQLVGRSSPEVSLTCTVNDQEPYTFPALGDVGGTIATDGTEWETVTDGLIAGKTFANGNKGFGWTYAKFTVPVTDGKLTIQLDASSNTLHTWSGVDDFKLYKLAGEETVVVEVTAAGWGTMMLPFAAQIPSGMKVYSCNASGNGYLILTEESAIAANTPYIVNGAGYYTFKGVNVAEKDSYTAGYLTGVFADTEAPEGSYVLQNQAGKGVAFYNVQDVKPMVTAKHAYVTIPAGLDVNVRALMLPDSDVTGIETVEAADALVDVYSISGVLVRSGVKKSEALNGLAKGIYVVNGTKQAVK